MTEQTTCNRTGEACTNCGCHQESEYEQLMTQMSYAQPGRKFTRDEMNERGTEELSAEMNHSDADDFLNLAPRAFTPQYLKPKPRGELRIQFVFIRLKMRSCLRN